METVKTGGIEISVELITEQLESLGWTRPAKPKVWVPEAGEKFWYVNQFCVVVYAYYETTSGRDRQNLATGNFFKTSKEAETHRDKIYATQRVLMKLRELEGDFVADWFDINQRKYRPRFEPASRELKVSWDVMSQHVPHEWYSTQDAWDLVIDNMAHDVLLMLGVEGCVSLSL